MSTESEGLRCLVACSSCRRQYDAAGLAAGSRFRCSCSAIVEVPRFRAQDAAVVRCSSCSAPRENDAPSCAHCGADYTLHEQDMRTLCPECMARVSDRARYCHNCATPIVPQGRAGASTQENCPACRGKAALRSRSLGEPPIAVLECPLCAGLWLGSEVFRMLVERARDEAVDPGELVNERTAAQEQQAREAAARTQRAGDASGRSAAGSSSKDQAKVSGSGATSPFYRPCPQCGKIMNRRNFGQTSGIVIDVCRQHGLWFDATELSTVLRWIRQGGEKREAERRAEEERQAERLKRFKVELPDTARSDDPIVFFHEHELSPSRPRNGLEDLLGLLFDV